MRNTTVLNGQTMFDIALQHCGSIEAAFEMAALNDVPVTSLLQPGATILLPEITNKRIVAYYQAHRVEPATEIPDIADYAVLRTIAGEDIVTRNHERVVPLTPPTKTIADFETADFDTGNYIIGYDPANNREIKFKAPDNDCEVEWEPM